MKKTIRFKLNGKPKSMSVDRKRMLLWVLRTDFGLTGAKYGCGEGFCGACTVLVNNEAVRSCQTPVEDIDGKEVITIEGLAKNGKLHPLQEAFVKHDALQCGYCTPGMILSAYNLLLKNSNPTRKDIINSLEENLCRCGAHKRIVEAVQAVAQRMKGGFQR
ncbi:ferredoxin [candidate division WOR-1 bacterium DG_54_3]|jgi:aerobic-type carbon monoxide dehydrogenase small subunit (CoxS/CutS family)|uniref:Ferredoxin n=1 Tax=candidate division WOR-1 bacterium DG_54_3 TaxID=1703775 RepID=A0A0S7Y4M4_UNCSA|nr:MAG: ferredoxin [candidate division WOR-1 bacterium DG_54_3]